MQAAQQARNIISSKAHRTLRTTYRRFHSALRVSIEEGRSVVPLDDDSRPTKAKNPNIVQLSLHNIPSFLQAFEDTIHLSNHATYMLVTSFFLSYEAPKWYTA